MQTLTLVACSISIQRGVATSEIGIEEIKLLIEVAIAVIAYLIVRYGLLSYSR